MASTLVINCQGVNECSPPPNMNINWSHRFELPIPSYPHKNGDVIGHRLPANNAWTCMNINPYKPQYHLCPNTFRNEHEGFPWISTWVTQKLCSENQVWEWIPIKSQSGRSSMKPQCGKPTPAHHKQRLHITQPVTSMLWLGFRTHISNRFPLIIVYPLPIAKNMGPLPASEWARAFQSSCLFSMTRGIRLANSTRLRSPPVPRRPQDNLPRGFQCCVSTEWDGLSEHPSLHSYLVNLANLDVFGMVLEVGEILMI